MSNCKDCNKSIIELENTDILYWYCLPQGKSYQSIDDEIEEYLICEICNKQGS